MKEGRTLVFDRGHPTDRQSFGKEIAQTRRDDEIAFRDLSPVPRHELEPHRASGIALGEALGPAHPVWRLVQQALGEAASLQSVSVRVPTEDGGAMDCMVSVFPVEASDHAREGVLVLMKDLRALTVSARTLRSLIRYSAQVAELGKATSEVTHEVKNPLNAMAIHLRLLKDRLGDVPEPVKQSLDVIQKQIGRLDSVVQNFMHSIRPQNLELGEVDVSAIVKEICSLLEAEWRDKGVFFVTRLKDHTQYRVVERRQLEGWAGEIGDLGPIRRNVVRCRIVAEVDAVRLDKLSRREHACCCGQDHAGRRERGELL